MAESAKTPSEPRCEECGFLLSGHTKTVTLPRCPECGVAFDVEKLWTPETLPSMPTILWRLCAPLGLVLALFLAASMTQIGQNLLIFPFFLIWASAFGGIGLLWPIGWTYETVNAQVPRRDRKPTAWRWLSPVLFINGATTLAAVVMFFLFL